MHHAETRDRPWPGTGSAQLPGMWQARAGGGCTVRRAGSALSGRTRRARAQGRYGKRQPPTFTPFPRRETSPTLSNATAAKTRGFFPPCLVPRAPQEGRLLQRTGTAAPPYPRPAPVPRGGRGLPLPPRLPAAAETPRPLPVPVPSQSHPRSAPLPPRLPALRGPRPRSPARGGGGGGLSQGPRGRGPVPG